MHFRKGIPIALLCFALTSTAICLGSFAYIDDYELWKEADTVVIGTVTSIAEEEASAETYRFVEISVERYLRNPSKSSTLVVLYSVRHEVQTGDGAVATYSPSIDLGFSVGERVLVFLEKTYPDSYSVYGGIQGKYSFIDRHAINQMGRVMDIPTPMSPYATIILGSGITIIILIVAYIRHSVHARGPP